MVGQSGGERKNYDELIKKFKIEDKVFIFENIPPEKLISFYDNATIFISASRYEPFGIVLVEAGARALPVIATATLGPSEIIEHEKSGLLVSCNDPLALSEAILKLLNDPERRTQFSTNLKQKVVTEYRWCDSWLRYKRLLDSNKSLN